MDNYTHLKARSMTPPSERMSKYIAVFEAVAGDTGCSSSVLSLSAGETEQQLDTVDNGIKTAALLSQRKAGATHSMERVAYGRDIYEASPMIVNFNSRFVGPAIDLKALEIGSGGPAYGWISAISHVIVEEFKDGKQYSYGPGGRQVYNDDHAMTTVEGDESTPDNPIMYTMSKDKETGGFAWYKILVNQVDPRNATREEMFAYLMYHNKNDIEARAGAQCMFTEIDERGVKYGLLTEDQFRTDYVKAFEMQADITRNLLETTNIPSIPGVRDSTQEYYDELLKMIDKMIEHIDKTKAQLELQKQTDTGKPEEFTDQQNALESNFKI